MTVARGGRLSQSIDLAMERLNTSVDVDRELWREDIEGSIAHARGLARVKVISEGAMGRRTSVRPAAARRRSSVFLAWRTTPCMCTTPVTSAESFAIAKAHGVDTKYFQRSARERRPQRAREKLQHAGSR